MTLRAFFSSADETLIEFAQSCLSVQQDIALRTAPADEASILTLIQEWRPDVALLDFRWLGAKSCGLADSIMSCSPETKLLVITAGDDEQAVVRWLKHGASGCVGTCQSCPQIVRAIHAVHAGEVWAPRKTVTRALRELLPLKRQGDRNTAARAHLSQRECEIVDWMCRGMSNKEIARILGISDMTVKTHAHNIFHKLDISGRVRLVGSMSPHEN